MFLFSLKSNEHFVDCLQNMSRQQAAVLLVKQDVIHVNITVGLYFLVLYICLYLVLRRFQHIFGHIAAVSPHNRLSWISKLQLHLYQFLRK